MNLSQIKNNILASFVVFVVAVPLTLGIALASGVSAQSALTTAVIGGIVVGIFSGAPLVVSGPAAGLASLTFMIVQEHGMGGLMIATAICGLMQLSLGMFRLGGIFTKVPEGILKGMLAAIGIMIIGPQLWISMGLKAPVNPLDAYLDFPVAFLSQLKDSGSGQLAILVSVVAILIQLLWVRFPRLSKNIPAPLPAVILLSVATLGLGNLARVQFSPWDQATLDTFLSWPMLLNENADKILALVMVGLGLGAVASAESLLTARAIENSSSERGVKTDLNRELKAQGSGNFLSSLFGGIPLTGVIVRSAANINAGAEGRLSTILHGFWILLFCLFLPDVLRSIPLAALASVLIITGVKLLNLPEMYKEIFHRKSAQGFWQVVTIICIMGSDLLWGMTLSLGLYTLSWALFRIWDRGAEREIS